MLPLDAGGMAGENTFARAATRAVDKEGDVGEPYDPLSYENLARSVVTALIEREPEPLPPQGAFTGAGVYAIYYVGGFPPYGAMMSPDCARPIYVGKAIPPGARKGMATREAGKGTPVFRRLHEHARSVEQAENLALADFRCRHLVVVPVWIPLAERFLIAHYRPVWNTLIDGFGNHDPGAGRRNMRRPRWDIIHPGRPWAERLDPAETDEQVLAELEAFLAGEG